MVVYEILSHSTNFFKLLSLSQTRTSITPLAKSLKTKLATVVKLLGPINFHPLFLVLSTPLIQNRSSIGASYGGGGVVVHSCTYHRVRVRQSLHTYVFREIYRGGHAKNNNIHLKKLYLRRRRNAEWPCDRS